MKTLCKTGLPQATALAAVIAKGPPVTTAQVGVNTTTTAKD
ncbi:hypothetical protein AB5I41_05625 [Sphingomonas sp. MMS24-JH45]